jgi:hypothetical protein
MFNLPLLIAGLCGKSLACSGKDRRFVSGRVGKSFDQPNIAGISVSDMQTSGATQIDG